MMIGWGIVMTLMGLVHNFGGLVAARIFLGLTEAGLFPVRLDAVQTQTL